jgi:hypothetical protein
MTIVKQRPRGKVEIDLRGPKGNAYFLMGSAMKFAKQLGLDGNAIVAEMKSGNYDNLVEVFDKHFGNYVTLYK